MAAAAPLVLVVPMDSGSRDWRMGAGPRRLVDGGLLRALGGTASVEWFEPSSRIEVGSAFEIARWIAPRVAAARRTGRLAVVLSGNCVSSIGTYSGLIAGGARSPGVCWFDAHADLNTPETTPSGYLDGMALSVLTGRCWRGLAESVPGFEPARDDRLVLFGARDLDSAEREIIASVGIPVIAASDTDEQAAAALERLRSRTGEVYLHLDLDSLDTSVTRINQYSASGGFSAAAMRRRVGEIGNRFDVTAVAFTAFDPACGDAGVVVDLATTLLQSLRAAPTTS